MIKINNTKLLESRYNPNTKESYAAIQTPKGIFEARVVLKPEDADIESGFVGCEKAEIKALRKYCQIEIREVKAQIKAFKNFRSNLRCHNKYILDGWVEKRINKELDMYNRKRLKLERDYIKLTDMLISTENYRAIKKMVNKHHWSKKNKDH